MPSTTSEISKRLLTDVLSARVPPGFGDQVRQAARAEGVRPGTLIREALSERISRVESGVRMSPEERQTVVDLGGEHDERPMRLLAGSIRPSSQLSRHDQALGWGFGRGLRRLPTSCKAEARSASRRMRLPARALDTKANFPAAVAGGELGNPIWERSSR